jgi:hypothetical protein
MIEHLSPKTLSALVKSPQEHGGLLTHLGQPCRECEAFLATLGGSQQREHLVAVLTERAKAAKN